MKKALLLIALFFAVTSSSFAGQYVMSHSGFDSDGQSIETGHAEYFTTNPYGYYTLTGNMYNSATTGEVFWYADCYAAQTYPQLIYVDNWHFYYPYFDSSPSFYHVIGQVPNQGELGVNIGVYGTDASITINW